MANRGFRSLLLLLTAMLVIASAARPAVAQCSCPAPRPMHATATSGVITMAFSEEFQAERRQPTHVEFVIATDYNNLVDALQKIADQIAGALREGLRERGYNGTVSVRIVRSETATFSGTGFEFLDSRTERVDGRVAHFNIYGRETYPSGAPRLGVLRAEVQLRAKVCVEANETHLTFTPETRKRLRYDLPETANISPRILEQKKTDFENRVTAEVSRTEGALAAIQLPLSPARRRMIREATVAHFEEKVPVRFFDRIYELPIRVVPLQQTRICSSSIGD